ncbi:MAG: hypothetical protein JJU36_15465 [Phycisphaeraceae bacterium]|nr:hypothetical protein [Phycisphaeraceae bacterium]
MTRKFPFRSASIALVMPLMAAPALLTGCGQTVSPANFTPVLTDAAPAIEAEAEESPAPETTPRTADGMDAGQRGRDGVTLDRGLERTDWLILTVRPVSGRVPHQPTYSTTPLIARDSRILQLPEVEARLNAAMDGASDRYIDGRKVRDTGIGIGRAAIDVLLLPINLFRQPAWSWQES